MKSLKELYESAIKTIVSTDNFTNIIGEEAQIKSKITVEDDFIDDGILSVYKNGAEKYDLTFNVANKEQTIAEFCGTSTNLIKFLLDICEMSFENIQKKYPKLDFEEYDKSLK